ncbi:MAG: arylsulfatase, partial [Myxococcota bacterium]
MGSQESQPAPRIGNTIQDSEPHWPEPVRAAPGTPNIVFVVFDDVGYGDFGCYGSEIATPHLDRLAAGGLRYTGFHTTGLCSATRACLLTGRNHHRVGIGTLTDWDLGFPGSRGRLVPDAATLAELLRPAGWNTCAVGKWHLTPMRETTAAGPYDQWPLQRGFDRFYGFFAGETNHWFPELTHDNHRIDPDHPEGYHLSVDLVDRAIEFFRDQKSVAPEKPLFLNLAFGACHAPHQAPPEFIDPYRETFAAGYDWTRNERFARQLELGIVPSGTRLTPRHPSVKPWDELSPERQESFIQLQAAYAGMLEHADVQLGRFVHFLEEIGQLENTVLFILSDNGASQEGTPIGTVNSMRVANGVRDSVEANLAAADQIGGPLLNNNYPLGWAMAGNTPLKRFKQNVHGGGVRDPLIVHWPAGIGERGGLRHGFLHAADLPVTVLEMAGIEAPEQVAGLEQVPFDGVSVAATFSDANAVIER